MTVSAADSQKQRGQTAYVILEAVDKENGADWAYFRTVEAPSAAAALRKAITETGEYVAIPSRSWEPVQVSVSQTTVVKVGEPT